MTAMLFGYLVPLVHVTACIFLIVVVLLQTGKGADMGAVLGGGSQTLFGASGAGNLLTKLTTGMAMTFMATSMLIAIGQRQKPASSLLDKVPETPAAQAPIDVPLPPTAAAPGTPSAATPPAVPGAPVAEVPADANKNLMVTTEIVPDAPASGDAKPAADASAAPAAPAAPSTPPAAPAAP